MTKREINWTEIQRLLDRFYDGTTTPDEERYLMQVLTGDDVSDHLKADAEVFRALSEESCLQHQEPELPEGMEQRLIERIRQEEAAASVIPLHPISRIQHRWWTAAAACLLIAILSVPQLFRQSVNDEQRYAASDISQQEAEEYADYALAMISSHLKEGIEGLDEVARVQEQIRTSLNEIAY